VGELLLLLLLLTSQAIAALLCPHTKHKQKISKLNLQCSVQLASSNHKRHIGKYMTELNRRLVSSAEIGKTHATTYH